MSPTAKPTYLKNKEASVPICENETLFWERVNTTKLQLDLTCQYKLEELSRTLPKQSTSNQTPSSFAFLTLIILYNWKELYQLFFPTSLEN